VGEVSAADFTVADVLAWARTKPANEAYDYSEPGACALCQFLRETGRIADPSVNPTHYRERYSGGLGYQLPRWADVAAIGAGEACGDSISERWTFGRLVKRLEALVPETPITPSNWLQIDAHLTDIEQVQA
jgi:hypothetical protein